MSTPAAYEDWVIVPRIAIELPVELPAPDGFDPADPATWPVVHGRLEYVDGRLLYMPPCGGDQQRTAAGVVKDIAFWCDAHVEFVPGSNEAGMMLGDVVRGADAAIWRVRDVGPSAPGFHRTPPVLAIEIAGKDEPAEGLLEKAVWYLDHGVEVVWVLIPATRTVLIRTPEGTTRVGPGERIPLHPSLPGLEPLVDDLFRFVTRG
jgi:Uma2 family endonuclease